MRILPKWTDKWPVLLAMILTSVLMMAGCGGTASTSNNVTATPTFSPGGGTYNTSQSVTISDATSGAVFYCTTDGTTPTSSSPQCAQPTIVYKTEFLQAIAVAPGKTASAIVSAGYTIDFKAAATPAFSPAGGTYTSAQAVTITDAVSGANIYYTTDGSTPTASSTLYTGPIPVSSSEVLSAIVTASGYSNSGVASAAYTIQTPAAVPTITSLSPTSTTAGGAAFTLTVDGTNFDSGSKVNWGSTALTTTYVSSTQLTAAVPANLIASASSAVISVTTSAGASAYSAFTVNPILPAITNLSPSSATSGGPAFTLTVNGTNFDSSAKVSWNGSALTTTYVSAAQVTAAVPANLIASAGTASITVSTTAGTSGASIFTIQSGMPTITGIIPTSATAGGPAFSLTVNGTNFDSSAKVNWNGSALTTTYVNGTQVTAAVPANLIASAGTASITVTTTAGTSGASSFTVQAAAPTITGISPTSATVGGPAFTLAVNGANFDSSAKINWNGSALPTTVVNGTTATANVPASLIASVGTANISVTTSGGTSAVTTFTIQLGTPTIATINPTSVTVGGTAFTLTVNGSNYDSSATVKWNGTPLGTTLVSASQLTASVPANLITATGTASITVTTTVGSSSPSSLAIQPAGVPTIGTLDPATATAGGAAFLLTVNGTGFDSSSVVKWNSTALTTVYVSSTELQTAISANLIASGGTVQVTVSGTGGASAASSFNIKLGLPSITGFTPTSASSNDPAFTTLTVSGTNFDSNAVVYWNNGSTNTALTTTYVNVGQVTAAVPASLIASPGTASITVTTTAGASAASNFTINLGKPTISSTNPTSATAGGGSFTLKVTGTNFDSSAKISWNGAAQTTQPVSPTEVDASIDSSLITSSGSATIIVTNSAGTSNSFTLPINVPSTTVTAVSPAFGVTAGGTTVTITGTGFSGATAVNFGKNAVTNITVNTAGTSITAVSPAGSNGTVDITVVASSGTSATVNADQFTYGPVITGQVISGTTAISGATVQLYAAGTTGYGSTPTTADLNIKGSLTTDANGNFAMLYTCPAAPEDLLYLVASGGNAGKGTNTNINLMTALGSCNSSSFPSTATVNEVTTIASAYALSGFAKQDSSRGIDIGAPGTGSECNAANKDINGNSQPWHSTGPETCNYNGLVSAFKTVNNLVNVTGTAQSYTNSCVYDTSTTPPTYTCTSGSYSDAAGAARSITPAYANGVTPKYSTTGGSYSGSAYPAVAYLNSSTVPTLRINALADMLASCVKSDGSGCASGLFAGATTGAATSTSTPNVPNVTPGDTLQAALNIAQNPGNNVSTLLGLVSSTPPYSTGTLLTQTTKPVDLALALTYTGAGLGLDPSTVDNVNQNGSMTDSAGDTGIAPNVDTALAVDASGNIWVAAYSDTLSYGGFTPLSPFLAVFDNLGTPLTPPTTMDNSLNVTFGGFSPHSGSGNALNQMVFDQAGNLWVTENASNGLLDEITGFPSSLTSTTITSISSSLGTPKTMAVDGNIVSGQTSGNVWLWGSNDYLYEIAPGSQVQKYFETAGMSGVYAIGNMVFDSYEDMWLTNTNTSGAPPFKRDFIEVASAPSSASSPYAFGSAPVLDAIPSGETSTNYAPPIAGSNGNLYLCSDSSGIVVDTFISGNGKVGSFTPASGLGCGGQMVLDGQSHFFAVTNLSSVSHRGSSYLDEFTTSGAQVLPVLDAQPGTSSAEPPTLAYDGNEGPYSTWPGVNAVMDASGNLWVLNTDTNGGYWDIVNQVPITTPVNVLVEYVGIGAPVVTPASVALSNGALGTRP